MEESSREGVGVIKRPADISGDEAPTIDAVFHALNECSSQCIYPDVVVLLQPTSPLRTAEDIDTAVELFLRGDCDSVISVVETDHPPFWCRVIEDSYLKPLFENEKYGHRRQDFPKTYLPNGAIYITSAKKLEQFHSFFTSKTKPYIMPTEKSLDIDKEFDFMVAEMLIKENEHLNNRNKFGDVDSKFCL